MNKVLGGAQEIWLAEIYRDASNIVRYAGNIDADVTWNSLTWTRKGIRVDPPTADIVGTQGELLLTISDANHTDVDRLAAGEYIDHRATVYLVNRDNLSDATDYIKWRGLILDADVEEGTVTLRVGLYAFGYISIPRCTMERDCCNNDFKDARCAYAGVDTTCLKTLVDCTAKSNKTRFRGFPGMLKLRP